MYFNIFWAVLRRDLLLLWRQPADVVLPLIFLLLLISLFPLGLNQPAQWLKVGLPAIVWMGVLVTTLLTLERSVRADIQDGSLEQLWLAACPAPLWLLAKMLAHWLSSGLPMVLLAPLVGLGLGLPWEVSLVLGAALLLGSPILSLTGVVMVALAQGAPRGGLLLALLCLPLWTPVLIFGAGVVAAAQSGFPIAGALYFLAMLLMITLCFAPFAAAGAIKLVFS